MLLGLEHLRDGRYLKDHLLPNVIATSHMCIYTYIN